MSKIKIGIAGLGTVGSAVIHHLKNHQDFEVVAVSARAKSKARSIDISAFTWHDNPIDMAYDKNIDVVVELMGGDGDPAYSLIIKSLSNKKSVVTANKALLASYGLELAKLAEDNKVGLYFEAAVAGGIPIIKLLREGLAANDIQGFYAILNGTCNYILTTMDKTGRRFDDVLQEAQKLGFAEADPSLDIDGGDTAHKLSILACLAYGRFPHASSMVVNGIRDITSEDIQIAKEFGMAIKLIGYVAKGEPSGHIAFVSPALIPLASPLAHVEHVLNAVLTEGHMIGQSFISGRGAGGDATASAVIADLLDVRKSADIKPFMKPANTLMKTDFKSLREWVGEFYIRISVQDEVGVIADLTSRLRDNSISIESLIQKSQSSDKPVSIITMTHTTQGCHVQDAMAQIAELPFVQGEPLVMPVLRV
jgi:homoserine dehydrogenase